MSSGVLQRVVAGDGEVEAGLVDRGWLTVEGPHRGWTQQFGIVEFENIWTRRDVIFSNDTFQHLPNQFFL